MKDVIIVSKDELLRKTADVTSDIIEDIDGDPQLGMMLTLLLATFSTKLVKALEEESKVEE